MRRHLTAALLLLVASVAAACSDDSGTVTTGAAGDGSTTTTDATTVRAPSSSDPATGTVLVGVEEVPLEEGFHLSLRFEAPDGTVLAEHTWDEIVRARASSDGGVALAWYDTVHEEVLLAGPVRLVTVVEIGMELPAKPPCITDVIVEPATVVDVTVFLRVHDDGSCAAVGGAIPVATTIPAGAGPATPVRFDGALEILSDRGGCGAAHFYAITPDDEILLHAWAQDLLLANRELAGTTVERQLTLPSSELAVYVEEGPGVRGHLCTDVGGDPVVLRTWTAVAGTATLTLDIVAPEWDSTGDLALRDVVLASDDGRKIEMDDISWADVPVATQQG